MLQRTLAGGELPPLHAAGRTLVATPQRLGLLAPSDSAEPPERLLNRFRRDGYLFLRGFLDRDAVLALRRHVFAAFADTGLIASGRDPLDGIAAVPYANGDAVRRRLMEIVRSAAFESFCLQPRLWQFLDGFLGGMSYLHKRKLLRHTLPGQAFSTPAHYDLIYLRGGTDRIVTAWIPIGDVPMEMGGLCYLEGSHAEGVKLEAQFNAANAALSPQERISAYNSNMSEGGWIAKDLVEMADRFDRRWLVADYEAGDIVLHSPFMIHAATANEDPAGRIRLSCDIRYQNVRDEIDARWANHWSLDDML